MIDGNNASRVFHINSATVTMTGLTIRRGNGNAGGEGGAFYVNSSTLRLFGSTVDGNVTSGAKQGGGIYGNSGVVQLTNSTVSGNSAPGSQGGGIYANGGSILLLNSTISGNTAASGGGGGIYRNAPLTIRNTIVANSTGGQIAGSGTITSNAKNLVEGGCTGCAAGDLTADPNLGALADNGGDSYTHALLTGSVAIDAAATADAPATDQRGITRPQGTTADIGSYELETAPPASVTPDGGQALQRLPSNGTNYTFQFTVTNDGTSAATFGLKAFRRSGTALAIVSVNGVAGDTTALALNGGASSSVPVVYSVSGVPAGTLDTLLLRARATTGGAVSDTGFADLTVVRPSLAISKSASPPGNPAPGAELTYTIDVTNVGTDSAVSVVHVDSLPGQVQFKVGSVSETLPAGVTVARAYSNDGGASWVYVPASGGCGAPAGYDGCVTRIRWALQASLSTASGQNTVEFRFVTRVP